MRFFSHKNSNQKFSFHYVAYAILTFFVVFSVVRIVQSATPNPGHPWIEVGDGNITFTGTTTNKTFTLPDANATILTTNDLVTVGQGGTGASTLTGILIGNGTSAFTSTTLGAGQSIRRNATDTAYEAFTAGSGDVTGPSSANDGGVALFDTTTGKLLKNSSNFVQLANGNVGIGTTNPSQKLHVNNGYIFLSENYGITWSNGSESIVGLGSAGNYSLQFNTYNGSNNTEKMRITGSGLVGIGTTSPTAILHIKAGTATAGTAPLKLTSGVNLSTPEAGAMEFDGTRLYFTPSGNRETLAFTSDLTTGYVPYTGATSNLDLGLHNLTVDTNTLFVDATNHNVGIGTTNPAQKLHVLGHAVIGDGGGAAALWLNGTSYGGIGTGTSGSTLINLTTGGNVGIGLVNPQRLLSLYTASDSTLQLIDSASGSASSDGLIIQQGGVSSFIKNQEVGPLRFGTSDTERMRIDSSGNVGIGTTSPNYSLHVTGNTSTSGVSSQAGFDIDLVTPPTAPTYTLSSGGNVDTGTHYYFVTYTTAIGETSAGSVLNATITAGDNTVNLTIPTSSDPRVTGRKIYRTKIGATSDSEYYLATINDNTTTSYVDTTADSSLTGTNLNYYRVNSTSKYITIDGVQHMVSDSNLTALGRSAGSNLLGNYSPIRTVLIGAGAGQNITTGTANVIVGVAGSALTTGGSNTLIGDLAGYVQTTASSNTIIGGQAGRFITTGGSNLIIGADSAKYLADGSTQLTQPTNSVYLGNSIRANAINETNAIAIGYGAYSLGSNSVVLGNDSITKTILKGNVGIGTTMPSSKLEVVGALRIDAETGDRYTQFSQSAGIGAPLSLSFGGTGTGSYLDITQAHPYYGFLMHGSGTWGGQGIQSDGTFGISHGSNAEDIAFYSQNFTGETMRIKGSGNVGIGTTSPTAPLSLGILSGTGSSLAMTLGHKTSSYYQNKIYVGIDASVNANNYIALNVPQVGGVDSEIIRFNGAGNVGIGTTAPTSQLHIVSSSTNDTANFYGNSGTANVLIGANGKLISSGGQYRVYSSTNVPLALGSNNSYDDLFINTSGKVGIGTTNPSYTLHVSNGNNSEPTATFTSSNTLYGTQFVLDSTGAGGREFRFFSTGSTNPIGGGKTGIYDASASSYRLVMDSSGNVGIGTTAPGYKLQVEGAMDSSAKGPFYISASSVPAGARYGVGFGLDASTNSMGGRNYSIMSGGTNAFVTGFAVYDSTSSAYRFSINSSGYTTIGTISSQNATSASQLGVNGNVSIGNGYFQTAAPTNGMIVEGNVGIGLTAPSEKLAVAGNILANGQIRSLIGGENINIVYAQGAQNYNGSGSYAYGQTIYYKAYAKNSSGEWEQVPYSFSTYIDDQGAQENDTVSIEVDASGGEIVDQFIITRSLDGGVTYNYYHDSGTNFNDYYYYVTDDDTIWTSGTFTPPSSSSVDTRLGYLDGNNDLWGLHTTGSAYISGNVGIGTTSPNYALEVNGVIYSSDSNYISGYSVVGRTSVESPMFFNTTDANTVITTRTATKDIVFILNQGTGAEIMRLTSAGNVGIGTSNPTSKLEVVGDVHINSPTGSLKFGNDFEFVTGTSDVTVKDSGGNTIMIFDEL